MKSNQFSLIGNLSKRFHHRRFVRRRVAERYPDIEMSLKNASNDSVLLVGNSHAEFLELSDFAGRPCFNLGIGGSTAADCATFLSSLRPPVRCAASVLIVGTNDILRWRRPERASSEGRFEADLGRILRLLALYSAEVFVAALPPIGAWVKSRDPGCVATFSARMEALCAEGGRVFFDPFSAMRDGGPGLATTNLHRDGVHMANYAQLGEEIVRLVAPRIAESPARTSVRLDQHNRSASNLTVGAALRAVARPYKPTTQGL